MSIKKFQTAYIRFLTHKRKGRDRQVDLAISVSPSVFIYTIDLKSCTTLSLPNKLTISKHYNIQLHYKLSGQNQVCVWKNFHEI